MTHPPTVEFTVSSDEADALRPFLTTLSRDVAEAIHDVEDSGRLAAALVDGYALLRLMAPLNNCPMRLQAADVGRLRRFRDDVVADLDGDCWTEEGRAAIDAELRVLSSLIDRATAALAR